MKKKEKDVVCPDLSKDPKIYETSCPKRGQPTSLRATNINTYAIYKEAKKHQVNTN